jgi:geranylgeranyl reductase
MTQMSYDAVVIGGGPSGATAADDLARKGWRVLLLEASGKVRRIR